MSNTRLWRNVNVDTLVRISTFYRSVFNADCIFNVPINTYMWIICFPDGITLTCIHMFHPEA